MTSTRRNGRGGMPCAALIPTQAPVQHVTAAGATGPVILRIARFAPDVLYIANVGKTLSRVFSGGGWIDDQIEKKLLSRNVLLAGFSTLLDLEIRSVCDMRLLVPA